MCFFFQQVETTVSDDDILSGNVDPDTVELETQTSPVQESLQVVCISLLLRTFLKDMMTTIYFQFL